MELSKTLANGKIMTLCIKCNRITHTYRNNCTGCGENKEYHSFFSLSYYEREELLKIMSDYHYSSRGVY